MSRFQNMKNRTVGKTKQVIAEIDGDFDLAKEGEAQVRKADDNEHTEERESVFGKLNDLTERQ